MATQSYFKKYPNTGIQGLEEVMNNLNREIKNIKQRTEKGMVLSAQHIRMQTETVPTLTPKDVGNLAASWFVVSAAGLANDSFGSGTFKDNTKQKLKASRLREDHKAAIAEVEGLVRANAKKIVTIMGYSANYALWVHEMLGMENPSKEGSGPKWFEEAFKKNTSKILQIIASSANIP